MSGALTRHEQLRRVYGLVAAIPRDGRVVCGECGDYCRLHEDETGLCALRHASSFAIEENFPGRAIVSWYFDPIPTNRTADSATFTVIIQT